MKNLPLYTLKTPTITSGAYSASDVVGGLLTLSPYAAGDTERATLLNSLTLIDESNQKVALQLYIFDSEPSTFADNAAFALTAADYKKIIPGGVINISTYTTYNSMAAAVVNNINILFNKTLYGYLVCNASTPTYTGTDKLSLRLGFLGAE